MVRLIVLLVTSIPSMFGAACTLQLINGATDMINTGPGKINANFVCINANTPNIFSGAILPGSVTGSVFGSLYLNTSTNNAYQCFGVGPCTAIAAGNWVCLNCATGGGSSAVFTGSTALSPTCASSMVFSLAAVSSQSPVRFDPTSCSVAVSASFTNLTRGAKFSIAWVQGGGGSVAYTGAVTNTCPITTGVGTTTTQQFEVAADGFTVNGTGCSTSSTQSEFGGPVLMDDLKTTGAAGGKKTVCVDTATGKLYASSTGTDCSN